MLKKQEKRKRRHKRVRAKISGTAEIPRLCLFRSSRHIYAQLINDEEGKTLAQASDLELKKAKTRKKKTTLAEKPTAQDKKTQKGKIALAYEVGKVIAQKAIEKKIKKIVFDRGGYKYHGRVKALAEGAREGGLHF